MFTKHFLLSVRPKNPGYCPIYIPVYIYQKWEKNPEQIINIFEGMPTEFHENVAGHNFYTNQQAKKQYIILGYYCFWQKFNNRW